MALTLLLGQRQSIFVAGLALEHKHLPYESQLLHFDKQEQQSPQMLKLNPRGRVPVLKDGDYVVFESVAMLYYLDVNYPEAPIFGSNPEEAGVIMRVICESMAYVELSLSRLPGRSSAATLPRTSTSHRRHARGGAEARTIEAAEQGTVDRGG